MNDPPIQHMPGGGFVVRLWQQGGDTRERARGLMRKRHHAGIQYAFHYYDAAYHREWRKKREEQAA